jgi:hypothetical protein
MDVRGTSVAALFWELPPERFSDLPETVVFPRVMERGTVADYRWLLGACPADRLVSWFSAHAARHLSPRAMALWACLLSVPRPRPTQMAWHG